MQLQYTNGDGVGLTFRQSPPFFLSRLDGIGNLSNKVNTFKAPSQDGAFFVGSAMDMRNITLEGTIVAKNTDEAYALRHQLLHVFTPKTQGTLQFRDRRITCVVEDVKLAVSTKQKVPNFFYRCYAPRLSSRRLTRSVKNWRCGSRCSSSHYGLRSQASSLVRVSRTRL